MSENDIYVAIQLLLDQVKEQGYSYTKIEEIALDAVEEWLGVNDPAEDFGDDEE